MSVSIGLPGFIWFAAMSVVFGFVWRVIAIKLADTSVGKGMAFIN